MDERLYVKSNTVEGLEKEISAILVPKNLTKENCVIKYFGEVKIKGYVSKEIELDKIKDDLEKNLQGETKETEYSAEITYKTEEKRKPTSASPIFNYDRLDSLF